MPALLTTFGLDGLSPEQRMSLIEELWDSLAADPEQVPVTDAQKADLDRRLAAFQADLKAGSSWDEVKPRLKGQP
jgi:putative addiction module component (TIGR02574 family)